MDYYRCSQNGMPEALTDAEGKEHWRPDADTWGETLGEYADERGSYWYQKHDGAPEENLRFAGQYLDRETGLHYNTFRYYAPDMGRFLTPDPIGLAGGINLYQYAPNPLSWIDPLGLAKVCSGGSPKDAQKKIDRGQGPKDIKRIDEPEPESVPGSQWHAHQTKPVKGKNPALNQDGSTHDGPPSFSKKTLKWLKDHGWNVDDWL
ncbi:RHS repeat-associated core domain-containing protein [Superficieibacter sp.]|uniref:RHS repeat-associated core domain-containing protein n=1 Tax=Superficieibacter sp. TaxID=2303322 RepID=UPI0028AA5477|nr:RHS repeat-associated core domain-containing protein [Superficieibacter sp.]